MMRAGRIEGPKIGRTWLVMLDALDSCRKVTAKMTKHNPLEISDETPHEGVFGSLFIHLVRLYPPE
jgi:hypothetical protein